MRRTSTTLLLDPLEDRVTPSVNVSNTGGTLSIMGRPDGDVFLVQATVDTIVVVDDLTTVAIISPPGSALNLVRVDLDARGAPTEFAVLLLADASFANLDIQTPNDEYGIVFAGNDLSIAGNVSVRTGSLADLVITDGSGSLTIGGHFTIDTGAGDDTVAFAVINPANAIHIGGNLTVRNVNICFVDNPSSIGGDALVTTDNVGLNNFVEFGENGAVTVGNVTFVGSSANDDFEIDNGSAVFGNIVVTLGPGDTAEDNEINIESGTVVHGNVTAVGGAGENSFQLQDDAVVLGNLTVIGGNGFDNVELDDDFTVLGSHILISTGAGDDDVQFEVGVSAPGATVRVFLGSGNDLFEYEATNPFAFRFGYFEGGFGIDTFTFGPGASIAYPFVKRDF